MLISRVKTPSTNGIPVNVFVDCSCSGAYSALVPRSERTRKRQEIFLATKLGFTREKPG